MNVSNTQIELFDLCKRKYSYVYREGLDDPAGVAAQWSVAMLHKPLAALYSHGRMQPDWPMLWEEYIASGVAVEPPYTLEVAKACFAEYEERFYLADLKTFDVWGSEQMFLHILERDVYLSKPDVVLLGKAIQRYIPMDFKSYKETHWSGLKGSLFSSPLHRQLVGQAIAVGASSFIVNVFGLSTTKSGRFNGSVTRHVVEVTQDLQDEWRAETRMTIDHIAACDAAGVWPKHAPTACQAYGERCRFYDACEAGALRQTILDEMPKHNKKRDAYDNHGIS